MYQGKICDRDDPSLTFLNLITLIHKPTVIVGFFLGFILIFMLISWISVVALKKQLNNL